MKDSISVIVPTIGRSEYLKRMLMSMKEQTLSNESFEIIVIIDGSSKQTINHEVKERTAIKRIKTVQSEAPGLHSGRHAGVRLASSNILVFADDDIVAEPTWLESIQESFRDPNVALVGGNNLPLFISEAPTWLLRLWEQNQSVGNQMIAPLSVLKIRSNKICQLDPFLVWGCNFAIRRDVLIDAGGFHPDGMPEDLIRFRGDGETHVSSYVASNGLRCIFHPGATVHHSVPQERMTLEYFRERSFRQGISDSYSRLRRQHMSPSSGRFGGLFLLGMEQIKRPFRDFWRELKSRGSSDLELGALRLEMARGWEAGFAFHQQQFAEDREIREWVLRPTYLEDLA